MEARGSGSLGEQEVRQTSKEKDANEYEKDDCEDFSARESIIIIIAGGKRDRLDVDLAANLTAGIFGGVDGDIKQAIEKVCFMGFGQSEVARALLGGGGEGVEHAGVVGGRGRTVNVDGSGVFDIVGDLVGHELGQVAEGESEGARGRGGDGWHVLDALKLGFAFDDALDGGKSDLAADLTEGVLGGVDVDVGLVVHELQRVGARDLLRPSDGRSGGGEGNDEWAILAGLASVEIGSQRIVDVVSDRPG